MAPLIKARYKPAGARVFRLLGNGKPTPIPEAEVEAIRAIVSEGRPYYPWRFLEKGKRVRVIYGPFAGIEGIILEMHRQKRRPVGV